jgi:hypothetical protein
MKKTALGLLLLLGLNSSAQIFMGKKDATTVSFFSKSPLEDIEAVSKTSVPVYNSATGDLQLRVILTSFKFKSALMEEHFNENYVESEKFPYATFKGKLNEKPEQLVEGENKVTITGKMELHGVTKEMTAQGTLIKKGNEITMNSVFKIKIADYNIKVPSLYVQNIAESVDITFATILVPYEKK